NVAAVFPPVGRMELPDDEHDEIHVPFPHHVRHAGNDDVLEKVLVHQTRDLVDDQTHRSTPSVHLSSQPPLASGHSCEGCRSGMRCSGPKKKGLNPIISRSWAQIPPSAARRDAGHAAHPTNRQSIPSKEGPAARAHRTQWESTKTAGEFQ